MGRILTILLIALTAAVPGCFTFRRMLDPTRHRDDGAQQDEARWGSPYAYEHLLRSDIYQRRGELDKALAELEKALDGDDDDCLLWVKMAELRMARGEPDRARRCLGRAVSIDPASPRPWLVLADLHRSQDRMDDAVAAAQHAVEVDPEGTDGLLWLADHHLPTSPATALDLCRQALAKRETAPVLRTCSHAARATGDRDAATVYLVRYLNAGGDDREEARQLALAMLADGNRAGGIALLEAVVAGDSTNDPGRLELIEALLSAGLFRRAVRHIHTLGPGDDEQLARRVSLLLRARDPWAARELIVDSAGPFPQSEALRRALSDVEAILERQEKAAYLISR